MAGGLLGLHGADFGHARGELLLQWEWKKCGHELLNVADIEMRRCRASDKTPNHFLNRRTQKESAKELGRGYFRLNPKQHHSLAEANLLFIGHQGRVAKSCPFSAKHDIARPWNKDLYSLGILRLINIFGRRPIKFSLLNV